MLSKYQDKFTYWHDKPCINGEPSSNNRNIYTAYAKYLAPDQYIDVCNRVNQYHRCIRSEVPLKINRLPGKLTPPQSKDEIIGLVSRGYIDSYDLEQSHWNFCNLDYEPKPLNISRVFRAVKSLWKIRKKNRNYFWENNIKETYCLAFRLMPWDRYYVKKYCGERPNLWETIAFYINYLFVLTKGDKSSKMLLWLQCQDMKHWLLKFINKKKWVKNYFDKDHPFVKNL